MKKKKVMDMDIIKKTVDLTKAIGEAFILIKIKAEMAELKKHGIDLCGDEFWDGFRTALLKTKKISYVYAYDPIIGRRVVHVIINGWAISLVTGHRHKIRRKSKEVKKNE